eukprot:scpid65943/ scgid13701/ 
MGVPNMLSPPPSSSGSKVAIHKLPASGHDANVMRVVAELKLRLEQARSNSNPEILKEFLWGQCKALNASDRKAVLNTLSKSRRSRRRSSASPAASAAVTPVSRQTKHNQAEADWSSLNSLFSRSALPAAQLELLLLQEKQQSTPTGQHATACRLSAGVDRKASKFSVDHHLLQCLADMFSGQPEKDIFCAVSQELRLSQQGSEENAKKPTEQAVPRPTSLPLSAQH